MIQALITWYLQNKRDLPWRNTRDPYLIWLSEIILQQTRVEQGYPYYQRFSETYPTVAHFAEAAEDDILSLWQGLGYYSRARNMHKTARMVMDNYGGVFPDNYSQLVQLKGIGDYTAAAISSFSSREVQAVVDGNVYRVLSRYFGIYDKIDATPGKKRFRELADSLIDPRNPDLSNQAMMEFGALLCKPRPMCAICPVSQDCYALKHDAINDLPQKKKKSASRNRFLHYFIVQESDSIYIRKRSGKDIWQNLYEFPLIETPSASSAAEVSRSPAFKDLFGSNASVTIELPAVKHILSHQNLFVSFCFISGITHNLLKHNGYSSVDPETFRHMAKPVIIVKYYNSLLDYLNSNT